MNERDLSAESQAITLGDEFLSAMLGDIRKNTEAITEGNKQILALSGAVGQLAGMKERMEALEKEVASTTTILAEVKNVVDRPGISIESVEGLRKDLRVHTAFFEHPFKKEVHYKHFLGWPVVTLFVMGCLVAASVVMAVNADDRADQHSASDIQLRSLRLIKDSLFLRAVFAAEQQFEDDPDQFRKDVVAEEERRAALTERLLELHEKNTQVLQLEREEKKQKK